MSDLIGDQKEIITFLMLTVCFVYMFVGILNKGCFYAKISFISDRKASSCMNSPVGKVDWEKKAKELWLVLQKWYA